MFRPTTDEEKARMVQHLLKLSKIDLVQQVRNLERKDTPSHGELLKLTKFELAWLIAKTSVQYVPDQAAAEARDQALLDTLNKSLAQKIDAEGVVSEHFFDRGDDGVVENQMSDYEIETEIAQRQSDSNWEQEQI